MTNTWVDGIASVRKIADMADEIKAAREQGALFHPTNPESAWFCTKCDVFGKEETTCWSCGSTENIRYKWVPRFGGGAQSSGPYVEE